MKVFLPSLYIYISNFSRYFTFPCEFIFIFFYINLGLQEQNRPFPINILKSNKKISAQELAEPPQILLGTNVKEGILCHWKQSFLLNYQL